MRKWHYLSIICLTLLSNLAIAQSGGEEKESEISSISLIGIGVILIVVVIIILFKKPKRKFND